MREIDTDATHNEIDTTTNVIWKIKKHCEFLKEKSAIL